jgi:hypothetical protein
VTLSKSPVRITSALALSAALFVAAPAAPAAAKASKCKQTANDGTLTNIKVTNVTCKAAVKLLKDLAESPGTVKQVGDKTVATTKDGPWKCTVTIDASATNEGTEDGGKGVCKASKGRKITWVVSLS